MNKYIKTDIENSVSLMKVAIMNALYDIDSGEEDEINLGPYLSWCLLRDCLVESGWKELIDYDSENCWITPNTSNYWTSLNGTKVFVNGIIYCGEDFIISKINDENN